MSIGNHLPVLLFLLLTTMHPLMVASAYPTVKNSFSGLNRFPTPVALTFIQTLNYTPENSLNADSIIHSAEKSWKVTTC